MANVTLWGASYSNVPSINVPKTGGGTASFTDVTDTTAVASDVASGKYFYTSAGVKTEGTGSGGGGSSVQIDGKYNDDGGDRTSISFDVLGEPTSFAIFGNSGVTLPSGTPYKTSAVVYDGTNHHAQILTNTNNAQASYDSSSFSHTYSNGTLTISSSGAHFTDTDWILEYSYGGTSANVKTADVQVGSGATSITFPNIEEVPLYWSCIFKSNFGTSNGYQRVICTSWLNNTSSSEGRAEGLCLDSQSRFSSSYWTWEYYNNTLTIISQGTNQGGYFHQPGYYQLTYVIADPSPYEKVSKTYRASTSAQTDKIEPTGDYEAMSEVNISIPAVSQTNLSAGNIKSGTTVTISNGQSNLWSVTGTYTGGGGSSMNAQSHQSTTRSTSTSATSLNSMTCSTAGTYTVTWTCTRSSTSGSWNSQLYLGGTAYGTTQTSWSNHVQTISLTGVSISANQTVAVYGVSRGSNYYIYCPQLTIIQTS